MKVILLSDVKGRGIEGDVIEVARGFAVNYLLPRKMAVEATAGNIKQLEARMHNIRKREALRHDEAAAVAAAISGKALVIHAKASDEGKLFGSVTGGMIAQALAEQLGVDIDRKKLDVHGHLKTLGAHPVAVHLFQDVEAEVIVHIVREGEGLPVVEEPAVAVVAEAPEAEAAEAAEAVEAEVAAADEVADEAEYEAEYEADELQ